MRITARKLKMTQVWKADQAVPVTVLKVEPAEGVFDALKEGTRIRVSSVSKGRGFQGVVKRYGFHGGPKSHGQKDRLRAPGSLGPTAPQRVLPGRRMAGHMGARRVTVRNLLVAAVQPDEQLLLVRGAVPGARGAKVSLETAGA
jgi:large subunit ribosomal protein L3